MILIVIAWRTVERETSRRSTSSRYPEAPRSDTVDDYHGTKVADPYRPLEDPDAPATRAWVEAENKVTFRFLESIPQREADPQAADRALGLREVRPAPAGRRPLLLHVQHGLAEPERPLHDRLARRPSRASCSIPTRSRPDGTVALAGTAVSEDGRLLAYGIAAAGSDWNEWKVRDVATGQDLPDHLKWIKFSEAEWTPDGQGFFYGRFPEPKAGR